MDKTEQVTAPTEPLYTGRPHLLYIHSFLIADHFSTVIERKDVILEPRGGTGSPHPSYGVFARVFPCSGFTVLRSS